MVVTSTTRGIACVISVVAVGGLMSRLNISRAFIDRQSLTMVVVTRTSSVVRACPGCTLSSLVPLGPNDRVRSGWHRVAVVAMIMMVRIFR